MQTDLAAAKQKYIKKVADLERLLDKARNEKREMSLQIENQKLFYKNQLAQQENKTQEQLREIKEQQSKLQGQVPNFKEKLEGYKKEFIGAGSLIVAEETYVELKAIPEDRRSLKEFLLVRIYEAINGYRRELDSLRRENDELVEQALRDSNKADRDSRELDSIKKLMKDREEDARRRIDAAERRTKELEVDLKKINSQY